MLLVKLTATEWPDCESPRPARCGPRTDEVHIAVGAGLGFRLDVIGGRVIAEHDVVVLLRVPQLAPVSRERPGIREAQALNLTNFLDIFLPHRFYDIHRKGTFAGSRANVGTCQTRVN
jgi:hypothetical protein